MKPAEQNYSPLYYLAALGNGGLAVSFFIYMMFLLPHPGTPMPVFADWSRALMEGSLAHRALVVFSLSGVVWFSIGHIRSLIWNTKQYLKFKKSGGLESMMDSAAEVQLMALPLTYAMTINVGFVLGALFVPGLWTIVEYLFPMALIGFAVVAYFAIKIYTHYFANLVQKGHQNWTSNNNLSQLLAIFAFSMVAVGFAAPAAMSHIKVTALIAMICSIFFLSVVAILGLLKLVFGFRDILERGVSTEGAPSLWILIPVLTVCGIAIVRLSHGYDYLFDLSPSKGSNFVFIVVFFSIQLFIGLIGYRVMKANNYFADFIKGDKLSSGSYALICPGVALMVFGMFFIHVGLVKNGLVAPLSPVHFIMILPLMAVQFKTIKVMKTLDKKHF
ncbi:MAG: hypothetical protein HWE30_16745 [Methylocystaceae bacterium]|nr:hypothetical protein [Methylocystaceae bacterium]